jgi:ankyrin repeat protein
MKTRVKQKNKESKIDPQDLKSSILQIFLDHNKKDKEYRESLKEAQEIVAQDLVLFDQAELISPVLKKMRTKLQEITQLQKKSDLITFNSDDKKEHSIFGEINRTRRHLELNTVRKIKEKIEDEAKFLSSDANLIFTLKQKKQLKKILKEIGDSLEKYQEEFKNSIINPILIFSGMSQEVLTKIRTVSGNSNEKKAESKQLIDSNPEAIKKDSLESKTEEDAFEIEAEKDDLSSVLKKENRGLKLKKPSESAKKYGEKIDKAIPEIPAVLIQYISNLVTDEEDEKASVSLANQLRTAIEACDIFDRKTADCKEVKPSIKSLMAEIKELNDTITFRKAIPDFLFLANKVISSRQNAEEKNLTVSIATNILEWIVTDLLLIENEYINGFADLGKVLSNHEVITPYLDPLIIVLKNCLPKIFQNLNNEECIAAYQFLFENIRNSSFPIFFEILDNNYPLIDAIKSQQIRLYAALIITGHIAYHAPSYTKKFNELLQLAFTPPINASEIRLFLKNKFFYKFFRKFFNHEKNIADQLLYLKLLFFIPDFGTTLVLEQEMVDSVLSHVSVLAEEKIITLENAINLAIFSDQQLEQLLKNHQHQLKNPDGSSLLDQLIIEFHPEHEKEEDTPLKYCISHQQLEMIKLLLQYGANINAEDNEGITPLHQAIIAGDLEILRFLLAQPTLNLSFPESKKREKNMPDFFTLAAQQKNIAIVETLLMTPRMIITYESFNEVKSLMNNRMAEYFTEVFRNGEINSHRITAKEAFLLACRIPNDNKQLELLLEKELFLKKQLLQNSKDREDIDEAFFHTFSYCIREHKIEKIFVLINRGAHLENPTKLLDLALKHQNRQIALCLLQAPYFRINEKINATLEIEFIKPIFIIPFYKSEPTQVDKNNAKIFFANQYFKYNYSWFIENDYSATLNFDLLLDAILQCIKEKSLNLHDALTFSILTNNAQLFSQLYTSFNITSPHYSFNSESLLNQIVHSDADNLLNVLVDESKMKLSLEAKQEIPLLLALENKSYRVIKYLFKYPRLLEGINALDFKKSQKDQLQMAINNNLKTLIAQDKVESAQLVLRSMIILYRHAFSSSDLESYQYLNDLYHFMDTEQRKDNVDSNYWKKLLIAFRDIALEELLKNAKENIPALETAKSQLLFNKASRLYEFFNSDIQAIKDINLRIQIITDSIRPKQPELFSQR